MIAASDQRLSVLKSQKFDVEHGCIAGSTLRNKPGVMLELCRQARELIAMRNAEIAEIRDVHQLELDSLRAAHQLELDGLRVA